MNCLRVTVKLYGVIITPVTALFLFFGVRNKKEELAHGRTDKFSDEHGQMTKVVSVITPIECYRGYRYFPLKWVEIFSAKVGRDIFR